MRNRQMGPGVKSYFSTHQRPSYRRIGLAMGSSSCIKARARWDLWAMPLTDDRKPFPVVQTKSSERDGQFSPDGKWIAYTSDETGQSQIYVQAFPKPSGKWQISVNGGVLPRWRADGKEIFYIGADMQLMAAPVRIAATGQAVEPGM